MKKQTCQSCGMPIERADQFGTEKDGSYSSEYCHYCYQNGEWTDPNMSLTQAVEKGHEAIDQMPVGALKKKMMKLGCGLMMKNLKRWK